MPGQGSGQQSVEQGGHDHVDDVMTQSLPRPGLPPLGWNVSSNYDNTLFGSLSSSGQDPTLRKLPRLSSASSSNAEWTRQYPDLSDIQSARLEKHISPHRSTGYSEYQRHQLPSLSHLFGPIPSSPHSPGPSQPKRESSIIRSSALPSPSPSSTFDRPGQLQEIPPYPSFTAPSTPNQYASSSDSGETDNRRYLAQRTASNPKHTSSTPNYYESLGDYARRPPGTKHSGSLESRRSPSSYPTSPSQHDLPAFPHSRPSSIELNAGIPRYEPQLSPGESLPRFVREQTILGEGPCFFYDDGTHCKTIIDGEPVNAHWGVTKAGKPRKRLAIACLTCREKKIKCDPDTPSCVQCKKFGRVCKFKAAPRGQQMSSDFPAYDDRQMHPLSPVSNIGDPTVVGATGMTPTGGAIEALEQGVELKRRRPSNNSQHHVTLRTRHIEDHEANFSTNHTLKKRRRSSLSAPSSTTEENGSMPRQEQSNRLARASLPSTIFQSSNWRSVYGLDASRFNREVDPIQVDPGLALQLMDLFFGHTASMFHIVPQKHFMHWVRRGRKKSAADLMVIYAILAMGTVFSPHAEAKGSGETFASIARNAIEMNCRTFSLQLVQSRILLAAYDFAFGNFRESWNGSILGLGVISGLKLNLEEGIAGLAKGDDYAYGLNKYAFMECCRRTYWSTYMIDRFNAFCTCRPSIIHDEDIFLRLPCTDGDFEEQRETDNPLFDKKVIDQQHSTEGDQAMQGIISHLIQISSILGDVISNAYRSAHGSIFGYAKAYEEFREQTHERLRLWVKKLPHHLMFSMINMTACIKNGHIDTFICMHAMYHVTLMNLNRSVHPKRLERSLTDRNIQEANDHAYQTLYLMRDVDRLLRDKDFSNTNCTLSNPFIGYAVTAAIEIISVVGTRDQIPSVLGLVNGALPVMEGLSTIWASAKGQLTSILNRLQELPETNMSRGSTRINDNDMFAVKNRLEATTKLEDDLIYATLKEDYVRAMELRNDVESVSYR